MRILFTIFQCSLLFIAACGEENNFTEQLSTKFINRLGDSQPEDFPEPWQYDPIKILTLDGGGVRGVISVSLLEGIEEAMGKNTHELFDIIAGTASGGIIALAMTTKRENDDVISAKELKNFFIDHAEELFASKSLKIDLRTNRSSPDIKIETELSKLFGAASFASLLKPTLVTAVDIERDEGYSIESDLKQYAHLKILDTAIITFKKPNSRPTIVQFENEQGEKQTHALVGGEMYKDNPTLLALAKAESLYGAEAIKSRGILLLSLGTGRAQGRRPIGPKLLNAGVLGWRGILVPALVDGSANEDDDIIKLVFKDLPHSQFIRIEPDMDINKKIIEMNNVDPKNIQDLLDLADTTKQSYEFKSAIEMLQLKNRT